MKLHYTKLCVIWPTCLHVILLFSISLLHLQTANIAAAPTNETDRLALLKFKDLIGNDPHKILSSWNDSIHFCNWQGVTCSRQHQRVTALDLKGYTLRGSISPYVGNLSFLRFLNLSDNFLYGEIPQEVTHLFRLQDLFLYNNSLTGRIPSNLTNCPELRAGIPPSLGNISSLQVLFLGLNNFVGNIPDEIGRLQRLSFFHVGANNLSVSLSNASRLEIIDLSSNKLVGQVPTDLGNLLDLQRLSVGQNNLGSNSSMDLDFLTSLKNCTKLKILDFSINNFGALENFINLTSLNMANNLFTGSIPAYFMKFQKLEGLLLGWKQIVRTHTILYRTISDCLTLKNLYLHGNSFQGTLPPSWASLRGLQYLDLSRNNLSGSIPKDLQNLSLLYLNLSFNNLEGEVPTKGVFRNASGISVTGNKKLCGGIPELQLQACDIKVKKRGKSHALKLTVIIVCGILCFLLSSLFLVLYWRRKSKKKSSSTLSNTELISKVSYKKLYQPSNVLLDNDMIAHVSDFGLARLLSATNDVSQNQTSTVGIKGSIGYAAPEYGMGGEVSKQGDVYSYGILVLEMFTGRRPTDKMFKDGFNLHNFVRMALPERLVQIVDPNLSTREVEETAPATEIDNDDNDDHNNIEAEEENNHIENLSRMNANMHNCLLSVFKVGLACSMESPRERINMEDVTRELYKIKNAFLGIGIHGR
uniref:Protein kinase domain-containing protein n=1 Tax=Fagus sylvatica TaxID=28930 RepID=A0A2N9EL37_FAGSY